MTLQRQDMRQRTRQFALRIIKLYAALPKTVEAQVLGKQVLRSGTSAGAHYREACRAKSNADFISKIEGSFRNSMKHFIVRVAGGVTHRQLEAITTAEARNKRAHCDVCHYVQGFEAERTRA